MSQFTFNGINRPTSFIRVQVRVCYQIKKEKKKKKTFHFRKLLNTEISDETEAAAVTTEVTEQNSKRDRLATPSTWAAPEQVLCSAGEGGRVQWASFGTLANDSPSSPPVQFGHLFMVHFYWDLAKLGCALGWWEGRHPPEWAARAPNTVQDGHGPYEENTGTSMQTDPMRPFNFYFCIHLIIYVISVP